MNFETSAAELHRLEAVALSLGLTEAAYELIAMDVSAEARQGGWQPAACLAEVRRRIHDAGHRTRKPSAE